MPPTSRGDPRQQSIDVRIARFAETNHGVFSRGQAHELGANERLVWRRVATGRWEQLYRGVYRIGGTPSSPKQALRAPTLAWGEGAIISHRSAAAFWNLAGQPPPTTVELIVPRGRARTHHNHIVHWIGPIPRADRTIVDSIPITTPLRTLIDLAGVIPAELLGEVL